METRPLKLTIVAWFSIIVGLFSVSGSGGYIVVAIMSQDIALLDIEWRVVIQFILSLLVMIGGIGVIFNKPMSHNILLASYGLLVLMILLMIGKYASTSTYETGDKIVFVINFLFMLVPIIFALIVLRSAETKAYYAGIKS